MKTKAMLIVFLGLLSGCTGLNQFPEASKNYTEDLNRLDKEYLDAQTAIDAAIGNADEQKRIRNQEIDRRLRVIDLHFTAFETGLSQENVQVEFLVSVVEVGVGAAGSLVSETASQILSAVSGGLAGSQQAYSKAALFDKTLAALLAQMIAGRSTILVKIMEGRSRDVEEYPLPAAAKDLEAYYFAGSLPGAIVGTASDATVKQEQAKTELSFVSGFVKDTTGETLRRFWKPDGSNTNKDNEKLILDWMSNNDVSTSITFFLYAKSLIDKRAQAVTDLGL